MIIFKMPPPKQNFDFPDSLCRLLLEVKPGVLLIDMQDHFMEDYPEEDCEQLVRNQLRVIGLCKRYGLSLAIVEYEKCGQTLPELIQGIDLVYGENYFIKTEDNAFINNYIKTGIANLVVKDLLFMGKNAYGCISETAESALIAGYRIHTAESVIGDQQGDLGIETARKWFKANGNYIQ